MLSSTIEKTPKPTPKAPRRCYVFGCTNDGVFCCRGCKSAYYCSKECQIVNWKLHRKVCGKPSAYFWKEPASGTLTAQVWSVEDMAVITEESQFDPDPPEEHAHLNDWWADRPFILRGKVIFKASFVSSSFLIVSFLCFKKISLSLSLQQAAFCDKRVDS